MTIGFRSGLHGTWCTKDCFDLGDRYPSENADKKFPSQSFRECRIAETRFEILGLAAEEDGVGCFSGVDILALGDCNRYWVWELGESVSQSSG